MFDKAFSNNTMDYELIFWGYTFAIKKITWFAQVFFFLSTLFNMRAPNGVEKWQLRDIIYLLPFV